jgi:hypothetical protein
VEEEDLTKDDEAMARALDSAMNGDDDQDEMGFDFTDDEALARDLAREEHGDNWLTWQTVIQRQHSRPQARRILTGAASELQTLFQILIYSVLFSEILAFIIKSYRSE